MVRQINIINLSSGLEFTDVGIHGFSRLQSSHLEAKAFHKFLDSVDNNILYHLSIGNAVSIYDCGSRRVNGKSRVIWQGLPLIQYCLENALGINITPPILDNKVNVENVFSHIWEYYKNRKKFQYFKKHRATKTINLTGVYKKQKDFSYQ